MNQNRRKNLPVWLEILKDEPLGGFDNGYRGALGKSLGLSEGFVGTQLEAWDILRLIAKKELVINPLPESFWEFELKFLGLKKEILKSFSRSNIGKNEAEINARLVSEMKKISRRELKELGSCKIDLKLGRHYQIWEHVDVASLRLGENPPKNALRGKVLPLNGSFILHPNSLINAMTREHIKLPNYLRGSMDGKSGHARVGLNVQTASLFDPGFEGEATMELANFGPYPLEIREGDSICAMNFTLLTSPTDRIYRGKFHGQSKPQVNQK